MKKIFLMAAMVISMAAMAQEAVITFEKSTHDFGKINEADGRVTTVFEFKNEVLFIKAVKILLPFSTL